MTEQDKEIFRKYIDFKEICRTRMAHHTGFIPVSLWNHIKCHWRLWRNGCGKTNLKHLLGKD